MRPLVAWSAAVFLALAGCGKEPNTEKESTVPKPSAGLAVASTSFQNGLPIPGKYSKEGENVSPQLSWTGAPEATKSFALVCDDPDAPGQRSAWVHWVAYGIPADRASLPEGVQGLAQGRNDFGEARYDGPMPPPGDGVHHYHFKVYALDAALDLAPGATKAQLLAAMEGHILAEGELVGTCERK